MCLCPKCGHHFRLRDGFDDAEDNALTPTLDPQWRSPSAAPGAAPEAGEDQPPTSEDHSDEPFSTGWEGAGPAMEARPQGRSPETPMGAAPSSTAAPGGEGGVRRENRSALSKDGGKPPETHKLSYHGNSGALLKMHLVNNLLTVLTLGIYRFWGKVKVRSYLSGSTELMGERFAFTGTGKELFAGWRKAAVIMLLAFGAPDVLARFVHPSFNLMVLPSAMVIIPFAMVASRRYRLSRTNWHGVRFSFAGTPRQYITLQIKGTLLTLLTLGFYSPFFHAKKERFWREKTSYGTSSFTYSGAGSDLKGPYLKALLLSIPTLGLYWFWYKAKLMRYDWGNTSFDGLSFGSTVTGRELMSFKVGNALLLLLTLGLAYPWVQERTIRFAAAHLTMKGSVDFGHLGQTARGGGETGEGLAGIFDLDMAI